MTSRLTDFIRTNCALTVFESRYGGDFCAVLENRDEQHLVDWATGGDEEWARTQRKLCTIEWYPMADGDTAEEAIQNLTKKLNNYNELNIPAIAYGVGRVSSILAGDFEGLLRLDQFVKTEEAIAKEYFGE